MQRIMTILCILFFSLSLAYSQPKITIPGGSSFDFGEVNSNMTVKRPVVLRNDGNDTLTIRNVSGSCGCTGTLLSSEFVMPGDSATLVISFDPRKFSGHVEKAVSMDTNDPTNLRPHITFTATVAKTLEIDPEYIVFHSTVNATAKEVITITNISSEPLKILSVTTPSASLSFESFTQEIPPGKSTEISFIFTSSKQGTEKGDITITTNDQKLPAIALRFFALVKPPPSNPGH